jgi:transposase
VTRELVSVTHTTVANTEIMCELMRRIVALQLLGPVTPVLDNARYQRNQAVIALAKELGITLLFSDRRMHRLLNKRKNRVIIQ